MEYAPTRTEPRPPLTFGRFHASRLLARTEYADVYQAEDDDGRRYALKVLRVEGVDSALVDALFQREIAALDGFEHEGIVALRASHREPDGTPVLAFDLVPGKITLDTLLTRAMEGVASKHLLWRVTEARRLVAAVGAAHARRVIHRDLKPSNVLLNVDTDRLTVCDFGVANVLLHRVMNPQGRTLRDLFTRPYAAPEQCLRGEALYPADVHALSLLVTALLGMQRPGDAFAAADFGALWEPARHDLSASAVSAAHCDLLGATLRAGLAERAADRPTLHALAGALEAVYEEIVPRPIAWVSLTKTVTQKLCDLEMTPADLAADLDRSLAVRIDPGENGARIKLYGESTVAVAVWDEGDERSVRLIDARVLPGPQLTNDRRDARAVPLSIQFGRGDGSPLVAAAREAQGYIQSERVQRLLDLAQRVIDLERARLPIVALEGTIMNGNEPKSDLVSVRNARVEVSVASYALRGAQRGGAIGPAGDLEALELSSIPSLFEGFDAMQITDPMSAHGLGKVTQWRTDADGRVFAVLAFDEEMRRPRRVRFHVQDLIKRRELDKQEEAIERIRKRGARLSALPELLTLTSAHVAGEREEIAPFQTFLRSDRRVRDIVERVLASTVSCVQGPPGTGKTTLIVELVLQLLSRNPRLRILICSQANEAVSNALERLQEPEVGAHLRSPPWVVRDVRPDLRVASKHEGLEPMFRKEAGTWRQRARAEGAAPRSDATALALDEWCRDLMSAAFETLEDFAAHVQVWGATTSRSQRTLKRAQATDWDVVVVDEAAKITLAEVLVPLVSARKVVLVGDHKQLPPFLDSLTAEQLEETGLDPDEAKRSLFQHLFESVLPEAHRGEMLTQSRMHPTIGAVVSRLFYGGRLQHNVKPEDRPLPPGRFDRAHRVLFLGYRGIDETTSEGSRRNPLEAEQVVRVLTALDADATASGKRLSVSIITPYRAQAMALSSMAKRAWRSLTDVRAGTVHSFQGRQSDVVVYSLVRTGATEWRFLADPRLFNVAMSRARSLVVLVGDLDGAAATPLLQQLLQLIPPENQRPLDAFLA